MNFREMRLQAGLTLEQAAEACDVSSMTIYNWEAGRVKKIPQPAWSRMCELANVPVTDAPRPREASLMVLIAARERLLKAREEVDRATANLDAILKDFGQ